MRTKTICFALLVSSLLMGIGEPGAAQEPPRFRMEGIVTEEGTQLPVAGATVRVMIESERDAEQRLRTAVSDAGGRYSAPLPVGHAWAFGLQPPAGYVPVRANELEMFATTAEQPVFKKDFQVRRGSAWQVVVRAPAAALPLAKTFFSVSQQRENDFLSVFCEVGPDGRGAVTIPLDVGGECKITCDDVRRALSAPEEMKLQLDKGFRTDRVTALTQFGAGGVELRDDAGRTAKLQGVQAEVQDGAASLVINLKVRPDTDRVAVVGRVVDSLANPLADVKVEAAFHSGGGSATTGLTATTNAEGAFRLTMPKPSGDTRVSLVVTKDGYGGLDTEAPPIDFAKSQETDVGSIKLPAGASIPIRVVGPDGNPLVGAIVEPSSSYAARAQIARTDHDGRCVLENLAVGVEAVDARFGTLTAETKIPIAPGENKLLVLKLSPARTRSAAAPAAPAKKLAAGAAAPDWEIVEWTDGKNRKLADYRGKVVVLDFWGVWCGPCVHAIPTMKQLHEQYKDRDVVFFGIHTAGTDMSLVQALLKQQEWTTVTGLDTGDDIVSGATVRAYAVQGFPRVMVVDREGKVAFNSGDVPDDREKLMKQMELVAKSSGLPWPLNKDASQEEAVDFMTRLQIAIFSREIDKALEMPRP